MPTFMEDLLPASVNPLWKCPLGQIQKYNSLISYLVPIPVELTMKTNYHRDLSIVV